MPDRPEYLLTFEEYETAFANTELERCAFDVTVRAQHRKDVEWLKSKGKRTLDLGQGVSRAMEFRIPIGDWERFIAKEKSDG